MGIVYTVSTLALVWGFHVDFICPGADGKVSLGRKTDRLSQQQENNVVNTAQLFKTTKTKNQLCKGAFVYS